MLSDINRGEEYFLLVKNNIAIACVAFENPKEDTAYLNRLSVLLEHRHKGIGETLVNYIFKYSKEKDIQKVSIGIIAEHTILRDWYLRLGFIEKATKEFDHLPFDITYMYYDL